jgi:hypothetical protein
MRGGAGITYNHLVKRLLSFAKPGISPHNEGLLLQQDDILAGVVLLSLYTRLFADGARVRGQHLNTFYQATHLQVYDDACLHPMAPPTAFDLIDRSLGNEAKKLALLPMIKNQLLSHLEPDLLASA